MSKSFKTSRKYELPIEGKILYMFFGLMGDFKRAQNFYQRKIIATHMDIMLRYHGQLIAPFIGR